jgi:hypothetical protein
LRREYIAATGAPDVYQAGAGWIPLRPHLAPSERSVNLRELRFALDAAALSQHPDLTVRFQLVLEDGVGPETEVPIGNIEVRRDFRF